MDEEAEPETVEVAEMLAEDLYPQASKYYLGAIGGHDHDDEDDEDDDEDENEDDEEDEVEDD